MDKIDNCVPFSGCSAIIMPQQPAQTGVTFDFVRLWWTGTKWGKRNDADGFISDPLVRSHRVVIGFVLTDQEFQVTLSEYDELADAFVLNRLNESLGKCVQVGRLVGQLYYLDPFTFEHLIKFCGELGVAILDQVRTFFTSVSEIHHKVPGLLLNPWAIWLTGHSSDVNSPSANMDEEKDVVGHFTESGPDVLGKKVTGPERVDVAFDKFVPVTFAPIWARVKAILYQDSSDGVCGDTDAKFPEFATDTAIAPTIFFCQAQDHFFHGLTNPGTTREAGGFHTARISAFSYPTQESFVMTHGDQFLDGAAKGSAQTNQKRAFGRSGLNLLWASGAKNSILGFQVGDLAQKNGLRHLDEKNEDRILSGSGHRKRRRRWPIRRNSDTKNCFMKKIDFQREKRSGTTFWHTAENRFELNWRNPSRFFENKPSKFQISSKNFEGFSAFQSGQIRAMTWVGIHAKNLSVPQFRILFRGQKSGVFHRTESSNDIRFLFETG